MNPFHHSLEETFRGRYVRATSNNGQTYEGYVDRIEHHDRHVILYGAEKITIHTDGSETRTSVGAVMVAHVDAIHLVDVTQQITPLPLDELTPAPYHSREFERTVDNLRYIEEVREAGTLKSFPVVRPQDDGYEIVEGHKRIWVCDCAGFDTHPVEIRECSDWEATEQFVADHLPTELHLDDEAGDEERADGWYTDMEIEQAIQTLVDRWGERALSLYPVAFNAERLDLDFLSIPAHSE
ncbi:hypothetical protein DMJ13_22355 [halophilic archaeon]|nr:hypothetical protein DMJ13_22355 [halophilic archaeon]